MLICRDNKCVDSAKMLGNQGLGERTICSWCAKCALSLSGALSNEVCGPGYLSSVFVVGTVNSLVN